MKKVFALIALILSAVLCLGCSNGTETLSKEVRLTENARIVTTEMVNEELDLFVKGDENSSRRDRTSFTEKEHLASDYLVERLKSFGYTNAVKEEVVAQSQASVSVLQPTQTEYKTYNVVAKYNEGKQKEVILCAGYDNLYSGLTSLGVPSTSSEGVADNATGVSALLEVAQTFITENRALDYTVTFVFFGASKMENIGSRKFVSNYSAKLNDILLVVNFNSLYGEKLYLFADDVKTNHEHLFLASLTNYDTKFAKLPNALPVLPGSVTTYEQGYSHYGLIGDHSAFFAKGVPCLNVFGGDYEDFSYFAPVSDTYESYISSEISRGRAMADTVNLVYSTLIRTDFLTLAGTFRDKQDYSFFTGSIGVYLVQIAIIILSAVALLIVVKKLEKKYPRTPKQMPRVKIAVFGMDYENREDGDVFVDLKPVDPFEREEETVSASDSGVPNDNDQNDEEGENK